ncbi:hypothetical protein [Natronococcus jeotgali]|uniref:hypothetical protein n=1 Tax=Natronococcus jeotgali TaxID=413812 RepID=UPI00067815BE|nr:hypothetical protein [Natronococcus jeotgali]
MSFVSSVEFTLVDAIGLVAMNRREADLGVVFPEAGNCSRMTADGLIDLLASQAAICVCLIYETTEYLSVQISSLHFVGIQY